MTVVKPKERLESERQGIQSIEIGSRLLDVFARSNGPLNLRDLAAAAGMSSSKAHRYLVSLMRTGLVEQDALTSRYDIGATALRLGLAALNRRDYIRLGIKSIIEINLEQDWTVFLSVWGDRGATVVSMYNNSDMLAFNFNVGSTLPLLRSATGRVFLAYLPRAATQRFVERELKAPLARHPASPVKSEEDVKALIAEVRKRRVAISHENLVVGITAIAAPILDHEGRIVASIASLAVTSAFEDDSSSGTPSQVLLSAADRISERLGFDWQERGGSFAEWLDAEGGRRSPGQEELAGDPPVLPGEAPAAQRPARRSARRTTVRGSDGG